MPGSTSDENALQKMAFLLSLLKIYEYVPPNYFMLVLSKYSSRFLGF